MPGNLIELDRIRLFAGLPPAVLKRLDNLATPMAYDGGQQILLEGEVDGRVFFVLEGTVRVYRVNPDGREQTLVLLGPGEALNLPAAFSRDRGAPASAVAVGPVRLLTFPSDAFSRLASETPEMALAVMRDLSDRLRHLTRLAYDLSLRSVRGRLARFLLQHAGASAAAPVRWTQEEIAAQIGTVREVVSRTLRAFVREGLVRMDRQRITLLDLAALEREADS